MRPPPLLSLYGQCKRLSQALRYVYTGSKSADVLEPVYKNSFSHQGKDSASMTICMENKCISVSYPNSIAVVDVCYAVEQEYIWHRPDIQLGPSSD